MIAVDQKKCDVCGTCVGVCPSDAIALIKRLEVSAAKCVSCGVCVNICPFGALSLSGGKPE